MISRLRGTITMWRLVEKKITRKFAGYFSLPQYTEIFHEETAGIDAIAWLLQSTSSQNPEFFKNATQIANSHTGYH